MSHRPPSLVYGDWFFNMLLFKSAKPLFYEKPVVNYRSHKKNISKKVNQKDEEARIIQLNKEILKHEAFFIGTNISTAAKIFLNTLEKNPTEKNYEIKKEIRKNFKIKKPFSEKIKFLSQCWQYLNNKSDSVQTPIFFLNIPWAYAVFVISKQNPRIVFKKLQKFKNANVLQRIIVNIIFVFGIVIRILLRPIEKLTKTKERLK